MSLWAAVLGRGDTKGGSPVTVLNNSASCWLWRLACQARRDDGASFGGSSRAGYETCEESMRWVACGLGAQASNLRSAYWKSAFIVKTPLSITNCQLTCSGRIACDCFRPLHFLCCCFLHVLSQLAVSSICLCRRAPFNCQPRNSIAKLNATESTNRLLAALPRLFSSDRPFPDSSRRSPPSARDAFDAPF